MAGPWTSDMDEERCYEWGRLFSAPWEIVVRSMAEKAAEGGLAQDVEDRSLSWMDGDRIAVRFIFLDDPSDFTAVRRIYEDDSNARVPACFIIVKQPDESDARGETIFDIFRLSAKSYLWHFNRVYTPPGSSAP